MFTVGQKVVAITNIPREAYKPSLKKKGRIEIIQAIHECTCGELYLDVGDTSNSGTYCGVCNCTINNGNDGVLWSYASGWAPIQERFIRMTFKEVVEEVVTCNN